MKGIPAITDIRGYGLLAGIDMEPADRPRVCGGSAAKRPFAAGLHIKCTADAGIVAPRFVAEKSHIDQMIDILRKTLSQY